MEYSKDIVVGVNYVDKEKSVQANIAKKNKNFCVFVKKHKLIATICTFCAILITLDCVLVHNFIILLQTL